MTSKGLGEIASGHCDDGIDNCGVNIDKAFWLWQNNP
jgi:hypothetical protein